MRSKVRFNQEIDTLNTIQIKSNSDEAQIFKNMEILCKYYSKIHLVSYLHLQFINNMMLIIFILASFISGMFDTINYKDHTSKDLTLTFGIIEIFLALLLAIYKHFKIPENQQDHYHLSNDYKILLNNININIILINTNNSIYSNNTECIKELTFRLNSLINDAPIIPYYIFKKYNIKNIDNIDNNIDANIDNNIPNTNFNPLDNITLNPISENDEASNDISLQDFPFHNISLNNGSSCSNKQNRKRKSIYRSFSIKELNKLSNTDIDNYNHFINSVNIKNEEKYNNNIINNFKNAFA